MRALKYAQARLENANANATDQRMKAAYAARRDLDVVAKAQARANLSGLVAAALEAPDVRVIKLSDGTARNGRNIWRKRAGHVAKSSGSMGR